eukprot:6031473-Amphidinium_carterae.1
MGRNNVECCERKGQSPVLYAASNVLVVDEFAALFGHSRSGALLLWQHFAWMARHLQAPFQLNPAHEPIRRQDAPASRGQAVIFEPCMALYLEGLLPRMLQEVSTLENYR